MSFNSRSRVLSELESLDEIEKKVRRLSLKIEEAVFDDENEGSGLILNCQNFSQSFQNFFSTQFSSHLKHKLKNLTAFGQCFSRALTGVLSCQKVTKQ